MSHHPDAWLFLPPEVEALVPRLLARLAVTGGASPEDVERDLRDRIETLILEGDVEKWRLFLREATEMVTEYAGDDVQALKAGIMEIADIFVVNKADREGADRMVSSIEAMLSLQAVPAGAWSPPVLQTEATRGIGVPELLATLDRFRDASRPLIAERRSARIRSQLRDHVTNLFLQHLDLRVAGSEIDGIASQVASRSVDPHAAARQLLSRVCPPRDR